MGASRLNLSSHRQGAQIVVPSGGCGPAEAQGCNNPAGLSHRVDPEIPTNGFHGTDS
jgi:hypothetical protein